ncbi:MAG: hypothetical protein NC307_15200 [Roseburia sp.]|nr:hypothetical protein [Roseburia sp.]
MPLFVKTIEKAKDNHFFTKLIKENLAITAIIEFVINYWTFDLVTEIIIVPTTLFIGVLYALAAQEKKYLRVKQVLDWIFVVFGFFVIVNSGKYLFQSLMEFFNLTSLQEFLLPVLLLFLNLPVIYGLALYNTYEQVFIRIKGNKDENFKMKWSIIRFAGIYLSKITAIRNNLQYTIMISLTNNDIKENLNKLKNKMSMRIGDNYMKRAHYCIVGFLVSTIGIAVEKVCFA